MTNQTIFKRHLAQAKIIANDDRLPENLQEHAKAKARMYLYMIDGPTVHYQVDAHGQKMDFVGPKATERAKKQSERGATVSARCY